MIAVGTQLGSYKILAPLGAGGMGEVYRARDLRLDRDIALKVLPDQFAQSPDRLARFEREAKAVAALSHPNVLAIHEFATEHGIPFAVMELLEGETVRQRLVRAPLPWRQALEVGAAIADGLAAAHAKNIVHRDLKPENVFLCSGGPVKILDFGLAREEARALPGAETGPYLPGITETGTILGTVGYMSPEQVRGEPVDARSDLFSFGCVLYEMLAGRRAFPGKTRADVAAATLREDPSALGPAAKDLPAGVEPVIRRCLRKDRTERFASARDLASELRALLAGPTVPPPPPPRRRGTRFALVAALMLVVVGAAALAIYLPRWRQPVAEKAGAEAARPLRVAVLRVGNDADGRANELSDVMSADLINRLSVGGLTVKPQASVLSEKDGGANAPEAGRKLQADRALVLRVRRQGERFEAHVQLIDVAEDRNVWGHRYTFGYGQAYAVNKQIALGVVQQLGVRLLPEEERRLARHQTDNDDALRWYVLGREQFSKSLKEADVNEAMQSYRRAAQADPSWALPHLGLANAYYWLSGIYRAPADVMPRARDAAAEAVKLDDELGEAHALLGLIQAVYEWDWPAAEAKFVLAARLSPRSESVQSFYRLFLAMRGRFDEALAAPTADREVDPWAPEIAEYTYLPLYFAGFYDRAIAALEPALKSDPDNQVLLAYLGLNYEQKGDLPRAIATFEKCMAKERNAESLSQLGHACAAAGETARALELLEELRKRKEKGYVSAYNFAVIYVGLGRTEQALDALQQAADERADWFALAKVDPRLKPLAGHPRFVGLLRRARLIP